MCGIAGTIYKKVNNSTDNEVKAMLDVINHRGPNDSGTFFTDMLALGQKRLSIVDLSSDGRQPFTYRNRYVIVFNGEIYNYLELKEELSGKGYEFATKTDTEVIPAAYDCWGQDCLNHFNGMWAFILYDKNKNMIFCSRDRFGVKPFYYYETEDRLAIGSEIKEFTVLNDWKAVGNIPRIVDFIYSGGTHDYCEETLFEGVYQLMPGQKMTIDISRKSKLIENWYRLGEKNKKVNMSFEEAGKTFNELFTDSVKLRLRSDVRVGSCLSGGLDSSSIVCTMNRILHESGNEEQQEVVFSENHEAKYDESEYVKAVIDQTGVVMHTVSPTFREILDNLDELVWYQDEPFGSMSIAAQWDVYEKAHDEGLTVMLDGQGADEYLAGYTSFQKVYFREQLLSGHWIKLFRSLRQYKEKYKNYYYSPYKDLADMVLSRIITEDKMNSFKSIFKHLTGKRAREDYFINYSKLSDGGYSRIRKMSKNIRQETVNEVTLSSLPKLVHHQDRNAMAHSIESRAPFLDYRLVEFVYNLPSDYKINLGITKYVMREGMKNVIPEKVVHRMDKLGFATPEDVWVRNNAQDYRRMLEEACNVLKNIIAKNIVLDSYDQQISMNKSLDRSFWCIICTAKWVTRFNVIIPA